MSIAQRMMGCFFAVLTVAALGYQRTLEPRAGPGPDDAAQTIATSQDRQPAPRRKDDDVAPRPGPLRP